MRMKAGSLKPAFTMTLLSGGTPIDLTGLAYTVTMTGVQGVDVLFTDNALTVDEDAGTVTHTWVSGETDTPGRIFITTTLTLADAKPVIFPVLGPLAVDIE